MVFKKRRTVNVHIRLTEEEKDILDFRAKQAGLQLSDFIRQLICYKPSIRVVDEPTDTSDILDRAATDYLSRIR